MLNSELKKSSQVIVKSRNVLREKEGARILDIRKNKNLKGGGGSPPFFF